MDKGGLGNAPRREVVPIRGMPQRRVHVVTSGRERPRAELWAYSFADLALLFRMAEGSVRRAARKGRFDPASLASILEYAQRRRARMTTA